VFEFLELFERVDVYPIRVFRTGEAGASQSFVQAKDIGTYYQPVGFKTGSIFEMKYCG